MARPSSPVPAVGHTSRLWDTTACKELESASRTTRQHGVMWGLGWGWSHGWGVGEQESRRETPANHKYPPRSASQPSALLTLTAWQTTPRPATQRMVRGERGHGVAHGQWPAVSSPQFSLPIVGNAEGHSKIGATTSPLMCLPLVHPASHHIVGLPWCAQDIPRRSLGVARVSPWVCGGCA